MELYAIKWLKTGQFDTGASGSRTYPMFYTKLGIKQVIGVALRNHWQYLYRGYDGPMTNVEFYHDWLDKIVRGGGAVTYALVNNICEIYKVECTMTKLDGFPE